MSKRYRLPAELGGGEVELVGGHNYSHRDPGYLVVHVVPTGPQFEIHENWLTEVPPPIPDEPEPGVYLIGGVLCERDDSLDRRPQEFAERENWRVMGESIEWPWSQLWKSRGGPDVRIVVLVPRPDEAAVERAARVLYNLERSNGTDWWATAAPSERAPQLVKTEAAFRAALNGGDHD